MVVPAEVIDRKEDEPFSNGRPLQNKPPVLARHDSGLNVSLVHDLSARNGTIRPLRHHHAFSVASHRDFDGKQPANKGDNRARRMGRVFMQFNLPIGSRNRTVRRRRELRG